MASSGKMSIFSVTSLGSKHILNYFEETVPKFSEVIFWYIIPASFSLFQSSSSNLGCLLFLSLSRWFHTASIIFRVGPWGGQSMTLRILSAVFLTKYDFTAAALCLRLLPCWNINLLLIRCFPEVMAWWIKTRLYFSAFHDPIDMDITNTAGRNAAPKQNRPSTMFHWRLQSLIHPSLSKSSSHILSMIRPKHFRLGFIIL